MGQSKKMGRGPPWRTQPQTELFPGAAGSRGSSGATLGGTACDAVPTLRPSRGKAGGLVPRDLCS